MTRNKPTRPLPKGPHSLTREQVEESQRERLYLAMIESVAEKGYAQTSVADVIARSGVSRATFYSLFTDKEDCFRAAYERAAAQVAAVMASGIQSLLSKQPSAERPQDAVAHIDWVLGLYLEMLASQPALAKAFLVEVYAAGPEVIRQRQSSLEGFIDVIAFVLRDTELASQAEKRLIIRTLVHAISSMVTQMVGVGEAERLPELRKPVMELAESLIIGK